MMSLEIHEYLLKIQQKDPLTCNHCSRAAEYAVELGEQLCLSIDELQALSLAAVLHDLGKIMVPDEILRKPSSLTEEEFGVVKCHPNWGAELIEKGAPGDPKRKLIADIIRYHHERYDGWGYPEGLMGEGIPLLAQIISIADAYEAMTSDRPYRKGMTKLQARSILREEKGKQFHPDLVDRFLELSAVG